MRLDRAVTVTLAKQRRWLKSTDNQPRLPILMYHSISDESQSGVAYFQTGTRPAVFARHMDVLRAEGYTGVTLTEGINWLRASGKDKRFRPVAITFDDGFEDFLTEAVPVLEGHGFKATVYLPTGFINHRRCLFKNRACLTWSEVTALNAAGVEFGSHTVTHPRLVQLDWAGIRTELLASKNAIEDHLGSPVSAFAYPYAFPQERADFVDRFGATLRDVGYRTCVTTKIGRAGAGDECSSLPRLPINSCDDAVLLRAKLDGAYDWLAQAQTVLKRIKLVAAHIHPSRCSERPS